MPNQNQPNQNQPNQNQPDQKQMSSRLEILKNMVAQNPSDSFSRYGLAMEYRNAGDLEAAMSEFRSLMAANPDYVAAYFHGGQTLERLGLSEEAREIYRKGIEAAARTGNQHARSEMEAALTMLG
jgi:tetratricopeptide (TPR) repeat protein